MKKGHFSYVWSLLLNIIKKKFEELDSGVSGPTGGW